jgi:hypothetical protein
MGVKMGCFACGAFVIALLIVALGRAKESNSDPVESAPAGLPDRQEMVELPVREAEAD